MYTLSLSRALALIALLGVGPVALAQELQPVVYDDPEERAAAWALLRRAVAFEPGSAALTELSQAIVAEQALTLAQNPGLRVTVGIEVDDAAGDLEAARTLLARREDALTAAYLAEGVDPSQLHVVPYLGARAPAGAEIVRADGSPAERAVVITAQGAALSAGVEQVPYTVASWPGADVFLIPRPMYNGNQRAVCTVTGVAHVGNADANGALTRRSSRRDVVFVARRGSDIALAFHFIGEPGTVDLTVARDPSPCD